MSPRSKIRVSLRSSAVWFCIPSCPFASIRGFTWFHLRATFNQGRFKTKAGKPIYVDAIAEGSGECIDKIVNDSQKADLVSPASEVFVRLGNAEGRAKLGREVIGPTRNLVLSPVVIGIWEPMATALGWLDKPIGWSE